MVRFSPSDCTSATEAGRPTVMGSMAPGKITVSRTVSTGSSSRGSSALTAVTDWLFFFAGMGIILSSIPAD